MQGQAWTLLTTCQSISVWSLLIPLFGDGSSTVPFHFDALRTAVVQHLHKAAIGLTEHWAFLLMLSDSRPTQATTGFVFFILFMHFFFFFLCRPFFCLRELILCFLDFGFGPEVFLSVVSNAVFFYLQCTESILDCFSIQSSAACHLVIFIFFFASVFDTPNLFFWPHVWWGAPLTSCHSNILVCGGSEQSAHPCYQTVNLYSCFIYNVYSCSDAEYFNIHCNLKEKWSYKLDPGSHSVISRYLRWEANLVAQTDYLWPWGTNSPMTCTCMHTCIYDSNTLPSAQHNVLL